jgi:hypothetical protein
MYCLDKSTMQWKRMKRKVKLQTLCNSTLDGDEWSASC